MNRQPCRPQEVLRLQIEAEFSTVKVTRDAINHIILVFYTKLDSIQRKLGGIFAVSQTPEL